MKHSDKKTAILMMTAFFLMFLVLWEAADLAARIEYQKKGGESYVYAQTVQLQFPEITELMENGEREQMEKTVKENLGRVFHAADMENTCNVSLTNLMLFVPSQKDSIFSEVVIKENIPLPYHLQEKGTGTDIWKTLLAELGKLSLYPLLAGTLPVLFFTVLFQYRKITGLDPAENLGRYGR